MTQQHSSVMHKTLLCISIFGNAVCGGGMYTFPILIPTLSSHLKLTQPQISSIILAGMAIQYPLAALVGKFIDAKGPSLVSLFASIGFAISFGLSSWEVSATPDDIEAASQRTFRRLTLYFAICGLATMCSLFSSLLSATKTFPQHTGTASGVSMALFGLSPLFLSFIASGFFTDPVTGLNVSHYLCFLAVLTGVVFLFGSIAMRTPPSNRVKSTEDLDENTRLLVDEARPAQPAEIHEDSICYVLYDPNFWTLIFLLVVVLGVSEMIMSNMGTLVLSLPRHFSSETASGPADDVATATQVRLLSLANTVSRLVVGPLADCIGPHSNASSQRHISRMSFVIGSCFLLIVTFGATLTWVKSRAAMWILSVGTGVAYGTTFTVVPSIVSRVWGVSNLGRNFGIIIYAPFIGNPLYSYLYAFVSEHHSKGEVVCQGVKCWRLTMQVALGTSVVAFVISIGLWKKWRKFV